ncbi:MAG: polysaccharide biosynthesis protein [Clostridia bacterium]|nr:polysaccharide biosynthesis protein [Clostridia bacterium]
MSETKRKRQTFLEGTFVLLVATAIAKVISAVYRIPLTNLLSSRGMGYYATAYDLYVPIYTIALAGLPVAISRLVAEKAAVGRYKDVKKILNVSFKVFLVTGSVGFIIMFGLAFLFTGDYAITVFGKEISLHFFNKGVLPGIIAVSPSLVFCCIMSAYRGYFEGMGDMTPTGVSEVIEAFGKLAFGLSFAYITLAKTGSYSLSAAASLLGISISSAMGTLYLFLKYKFFSKKTLPKSYIETSPEAESGKRILKSLIVIAIPIVLGALVTNVTSLIDVMMVQKRLTSAIVKHPGYFETTYKALITSETAMAAKSGAKFSLTKDLPNALYGCHRGYAFSIFNLIPVLTSSLGVSAIPVLATAFTKKDKAEIKSNIQTMFRTVSIIAMPCGIGIMAIPKGILSLLYSDPVSIDIAAPNLRILGISAILGGISVPLVNMLQAIGKERVPLINIAIGAVVKIVFNVILVGNPYINIKGVPISTGAFYVYICLANFICLVKYSGVKLDIVSMLLKPFMAALVCGFSAVASEKLLAYTALPLKLQTLLSIAVAGVMYLLAIAVFKVINKEDVMTLPKGEKVYGALKKLKIVK